MAHFDQIKDNSLNDLLICIEKKNRDSERADQVKFTIIVRCVERIESSLSNLQQSIDNNVKSSNTLSKKIFWLNLVLTLATVIIAVSAILNSLTN